MTHPINAALALLLSAALLLSGCGRPPDDSASVPVDRTHQGATAIEYGLIAALVSVVIIGALVELGTALDDTFDAVADAVEETTDASKRGAPARCADRCRMTLEAGVAACRTPPCVQTAVDVYVRCVRSCRGFGALASALPLSAVQYNGDSSLSLPDEAALARPERFLIPASVPVRYGDPGAGKATFTWRTPRGRREYCTFDGDIDRYVLDRCTDGSMAGGRVDADWVQLDITPGTANEPVTSAALNLERL